MNFPIIGISFMMFMFCLIISKTFGTNHELEFIDFVVLCILWLTCVGRAESTKYINTSSTSQILMMKAMEKILLTLDLGEKEDD